MTLQVDEVWKFIPGYPDYEASSLGRIRSYKGVGGGTRRTEPVIMKQTIREKDGRPVIGLVGTGGRKYQRGVHVWVAAAFYGRKPQGLIVRHLNDVKTDNRIENLCYGTHAENSADAIRNGLMMTGEDNPGAKLVARDVEVIRGALERGMSQSVLKLVFNISQTQMSRIARGESWSKLNDEALVN